MDKDMIPKISVIMPAYNCRPYIEESVNSILNQTFTDFEFIIIDDCSTDGTLEYLYSLDDIRIKLFPKEKNSGHAISLNMGLAQARGDYIARMDGDDVAMPERLKKQYDFLESNHNILCCGSSRLFIDEKNNEIGEYIAITSPEIFKIAMFFNCEIAHPSVMIRNEAFKLFNLKYDISMEPAEDYDLWCRLIQKGLLANIEEKLIKYRVHSKQVSQARVNSQLEKVNIVRQNYLKYLTGRIDLDFDSICNGTTYLQFKDENELRKYITEAKLVFSLINKNATLTELKYFKKRSTDIYFYNIRRFNLTIILIHLYSPFLSFDVRNIKFLIKCLIKWRCF
jgi:glycosyltransferase involved in cell wall biosynthesis